MNDDFKPTQQSLPEGEFVPFIQHELVPTPFPVAGFASVTFDDAVARARACLNSPVYVKAWVVSRDEVTEVLAS